MGRPLSFGVQRGVVKFPAVRCTIVMPFRNTASSDRTMTRHAERACPDAGRAEAPISCLQRSLRIFGSIPRSTPWVPRPPKTGGSCIARSPASCVVEGSRTGMEHIFLGRSMWWPITTKQARPATPPTGCSRTPRAWPRHEGEFYTIYAFNTSRSAWPLSGCLLRETGSVGPATQPVSRIVLRKDHGAALGQP